MADLHVELSVAPGTACLIAAILRRSCSECAPSRFFPRAVGAVRQLLLAETPSDGVAVAFLMN